MADTKISALPASTTPLAGTEVLPIVQSGVTKQVSVANLTTGRAISATQMTLTTGNLIVASGQGIDFSATPGTGTSELLADYEEGTWTVVWDNLTGTPSSTTGYYTKVGRQVFFTYAAGATSITGTFNSVNFTLPFTPAIDASGSMISGFITNGASVYLYQSNGKAYPESFSSGLMVFSGVYHV
jgi:hypothetical protein